MRSILAIFLVVMSCTKNLDKNIDPAQFNDLMEQSEYVVIDARTPVEFASGHLKNAVNLDLSAPSTLNNLPTLDRQKIYLVYCRSGRRSYHLVNLMIKVGLKAHNLEGGIIRWKEEGYEVIGG